MATLSCKLLTASAAAALAAAQVALAEPVTIDQVQLGNTLSNLTVEVPGEADAATAVSTSVGNTAAALFDTGSLEFSATQTNSGDSTATSQLRGGTVWGTATSATTAYGNAATGGSWNGDVAYDTTQTMTGNTSAASDIYLDSAGDLGVATTAAANVSVSASDYGATSGTQTQVSAGNVSATTDATSCCTAYSGTLLTTAAGNVQSSAGYTSNRIVTVDQTTAAGTSIAASGSIYMADGNDVTNMATSAGNSSVTDNQWGYASLGLDGAPAQQTNGADVSADSTVVLDHWSGFANSSAYGVGNSALVSNVGSDTAMYATQTNTGDVSSSATLAGQSWVGGTGSANAVSIGNAASTYLCNLCGDSAVYGTTAQSNSGNITATGYVNTPVAGAVMGSASAIGNASTFRSGGGN